MVRELLHRVESLEKKLDDRLPLLRELPKELPRIVPHDFEFRRLPDGLPEEWRRWLEEMPRFRGNDFKFDFRRAEPRRDRDQDDDRPAKPKKKPQRDDNY